MTQPITFVRASRRQGLSNLIWSLHTMTIQSMLSRWIRRKWREVTRIMGLLQRLFMLWVTTRLPQPIVHEEIVEEKEREKNRTGYIIVC